MYDKKIFLSQKIADKNSELMNLYFKLNKRLDNFVNYIDVELNMNKMSEALHLKYAHYAPIVADHFSDYNSMYSYRSVYSTILSETEDYGSFLEGVEHILELLEDIDIAISSAKQIGTEEENDDYVRFIKDEILELRKFKKQFILIYDKASTALQIGNTLQDIDNYSENYIIDI